MVNRLRRGAMESADGPSPLPVVQMLILGFRPSQLVQDGLHSKRRLASQIYICQHLSAAGIPREYPPSLTRCWPQSPDLHYLS